MQTIPHTASACSHAYHPAAHSAHCLSMQSRTSFLMPRRIWDSANKTPGFRESRILPCGIQMLFISSGIMNLAVSIMPVIVIIRGGRPYCSLKSLR